MVVTAIDGSGALSFCALCWDGLRHIQATRSACTGARLPALDAQTGHCTIPSLCGKHTKVRSCNWMIAAP